MSLERLAFGTALTAGGLVAGWRVTDHAYESFRRENMPPNGDQISILPYYDTLVSTAHQSGLVIASAGGIVKQALGDSFTVIDPDARTIKVSDNPASKTLGKATLYRPDPEFTLRDLDVRVLGVTDEEGAIYPALPSTKERVNETATYIQGILNSRAIDSGLPRGPVLSMFTYESPFDRPFSPSDYATRTALDPTSNVEHLFDNNGNKITVPVDEAWTCLVPYNGGELAIPTNSPVTILGRTLTRPVVARQRDVADVKRGVKNIHTKGLEDVLLGERWRQYEDFRLNLDGSLSLRKIAENARNGRSRVAFNMLIARGIIPFAAGIENSFLGMAIRDPQLPVYAFFERQMGANS